MKSLWKVHESLPSLPTPNDIDWISVEREVLSKRVNMKRLCEKYGRGVTQPTFKSWFSEQFTPKYIIEWGRPGRGNYIRFTSARESSTLVDQLVQLEKQHGKAALLTAMIQFAAGGKQ
jgi:hypothetical protein